MGGQMQNRPVNVNRRKVQAKVWRLERTGASDTLQRAPCALYGGEVGFNRRLLEKTQWRAQAGHGDFAL